MSTGAMGQDRRTTLAKRLRPVVVGPVGRVCRSCVMDESDRKIRFDEDGVCEHCRNFHENILPRWQRGQRAEDGLRRMAAELKRRGERHAYDCMIGVSGGVDSSYLVHCAVRVMGLRPLLFHVDGGWNSQEAVNNIEALVDGLDLELHTEVIQWSEMRDLQLAFFKAGVAHLDTPQDHAFFAALYRHAAQNDVTAVLTGANYSTECIKNPLEWHYHASDLRQLRDIHRQFGSRRLETFPTSSILRHKVYYPLRHGLRVYKPLNSLPYEKEAAARTLESEYGWQRYPQKHFESRFTRFYEGFWLPERFGIDKRKAQFSSLIVTGQMSRDEALVRLQDPPCDEDTVRKDFLYVAKKLRISPDELFGFLDAPRRSFRDFKSQMGLYRVGTWFLQRAGIERRVMR